MTLYVVAAITVAVPASLGISAVFKASPGTTALFVLLNVGATQAVNATLTTALNGRALRPLTSWARGESDDTLAAWNAALDAPRQLMRNTPLVLVPIDHIVFMPLAQQLLDMTWREVFITQIGLFSVEAAVVMLMSTYCHVLFRPPATELSELIPLDAAPSVREIALSRRIWWSIWLAGTSGAFATGMLTRFVKTDEAALAIVWLAAAGFSAYITWLVQIGVVKPSLDPLPNLIDATERVSAGDYTQRIAVTSADQLGDLAVSFNQMQQGLLERESLQAAFGSYVDPALAARVLEQPDSVFEGEDVDVSVFFADIRDFTSYTSRVEARDAVARLNRLFEVAVPIIREHGGHANKYIGDAVLAVFGTPQPLVNHADRAVMAALEVQRALFEEFGESLRVGIGVNSGPAIAGTIGGGGKLEFTVIGDTVNVASRIEALTKEIGDPILMSQATVAALTREPSGLVDRGMFEVRGKDKKLHLHGLRP